MMRLMRWVHLNFYTHKPIIKHNQYPPTTDILYTMLLIELFINYGLIVTLPRQIFLRNVRRSRLEYDSYNLFIPR